MLVGGSVRDLRLGRDPKDFDLEVYGLEPDSLRRILETFGPVNAVGEKFTVFKLAFYQHAGAEAPEHSNSDQESRFEIDVSIPRRESKSGRGHRGFVVTGDPLMTFEEAARRRDFTINAILLDPLTDEWVDPYRGLDDLERRVLRVVAPDTFVEDSLRVLRAVQLAARFELAIDPETAELCRQIDLSDLPSERVWGEVEKLLLTAKKPSIGLAAALDLRVLDKLLPELGALHGCAQDPVSHPEGDAFVHTQLSIDQAALLLEGLTKGEAASVMLATLLHCTGKPTVSRVVDGRITAPGHANAAIAPSQAVMQRLGVNTMGGYDVRYQVLALVREHCRAEEFYRDRQDIPNGAFRRLAGKVDLDLLYRVSKAHQLASGKASDDAAADWFIERARALGVDHGPPQPILLGRHLLEAGFSPGPQIGEILHRVYELQLDDRIQDLEQAIEYARSTFFGGQPG